MAALAHWRLSLQPRYAFEARRAAQPA